MNDGATGVVAGGCTGEFWALSHDERKRLYEISKEAMAGRGTLIVGTGAVTVDETVALSRHAEKAGVRRRADPAALFRQAHRRRDLRPLQRRDRAQSACRSLLYNIPGNAVNALTPALVARLADLDRVVAVKESSGDWNNYYGTYLAVRDRLRVFCGPSSVFGVPAVDLGADGTIDCFPNMWSPGGLDLYFAPQARRSRRGRTRAGARPPAHRSLHQRRTHALSGDQGGDGHAGLPGGGKPRAPLRALEGEPLKGLERGLRELGLL